MRIVMLVNPSSGRGRGAGAAEAAVARLNELGERPEVRTGASPADMVRLAALAVAERPDVLLVVGGDGTLTTILDEVVDRGVPLGLIPAGTGNDLARTLGLAFGSDEAAAESATVAVHGVDRPLDVGEAVCPDGSARFLTVAALGFDAKVSERTNALRWPRGPLRYYRALLIELLRLRPMRFSLRVDGAEAPVADGTLIAVGNTRSYGGGMPICPEASPDDGMLEVTHIAPLSRLRLLRLFPHLLRGTHLGLSQATALRGAEVQVAAPDLVVYADGERIGTGRVRLRALPGALTIRAHRVLGSPVP